MKMTAMTIPITAPLLGFFEPELRREDDDDPEWVA